MKICKKKIFVLLLSIIAFNLFTNSVFASDILRQDIYYQIPSSGVIYYMPSDRTPHTNETRAQIPIPIENATTTLRNFYFYIENTNTTGTISVIVRKNGVDTDIQFAIPVGTTGWQSNTSTSVEFAKDDLFSIQLRNTGNAYISFYHWLAELYAPTGDNTMLPEYIEQITSEATTTGFYLDKTISSGDFIIITFLFLFLIFGIVKFFIDWFIPKKLDWKQH